jgi:hypothetical protein
LFTASVFKEMKSRLDRWARERVYWAALYLQKRFFPLKKRFCLFDSASSAPIISVAVDFPVLSGCEASRRRPKDLPNHERYG